MEEVTLGKRTEYLYRERLLQLDICQLKHPKHNNYSDNWLMIPSLECSVDLSVRMIDSEPLVPYSDPVI